MEHCKSCKNWEPYLDVYPKAHKASVEEKKGGFCMSQKIVEEAVSVVYGEDMLVYSYAESGEFWTGPEFGCVHHETKE